MHRSRANSASVRFHAAIVCREYGLPAVVNVKHATRLIPDGQLVVVDGRLAEVAGSLLGPLLTKDLWREIEGAFGDLPVEVVDLLGDRFQVVLEGRLAGYG